MRPWVHKAAMSATVTAVVVGGMAAEGLILNGPGRPPRAPAVAHGPLIYPSGARPSQGPASARPRAGAGLAPQPGDGAHLVAEQSPSPRQPLPASSSAAARPGPPASPPAPRPSPDPPPQPSPTTPAPKASLLCAVNLLGIRVCLPGQGQ